jgi:hypothetical protein
MACCFGARLETDLVRLIQAHAEGIANALVLKIQIHPALRVLAAHPAEELRAWCGSQLGSLNSSLLIKDDALRQRYRMLGSARFQESIPLHEVVLRLLILKEDIIDFVREQGLPMTALDLYAVKEFDQRIEHFFDSAIYDVVCGYEEAITRSGSRMVR